MVSTKKIVKEKQTTITQFLNNEFALLHIDPKHSGVMLPLHLRQTESVTLKISRFFRGAMEVNDSGVTADLLFSGNYFTCVIPFNAIWGVTSDKGENVIWPKEAPENVIADVFKHLEATAGSIVENKSTQPKPLPSKGNLRRIK